MAILIIEHSERTGSDRLGIRLRNDGHLLKVVRVHLGEKLPTELQGLNGIISCGGPQPPDCDEPWVKLELDLLKAADEAELPILGICLGCQLLARALGGTLSHLPNLNSGGSISPSRLLVVNIHFSQASHGVVRSSIGTIGKSNRYQRVLQFSRQVKTATFKLG